MLRQAPNDLNENNGSAKQPIGGVDNNNLNQSKGATTKHPIDHV
jgi:hypothetical protein